MLAVEFGQPQPPREAELIVLECALSLCMLAHRSITSLARAASSRSIRFWRSCSKVNWSVACCSRFAVDCWSCRVNDSSVRIVAFLESQLELVISTKLRLVLQACSDH